MGVANVIHHSGLPGLDNPGDHTWALLIDGSRALAGSWDMASQIVTNVNLDSGNIDNAVVNTEWDAAYDHSIITTGNPHELEFSDIGTVSSPITLIANVIGWDSTLLDSFTLSDGTNASNTYTYDLSGTNHSMIASSANMAFSHNVSIGLNLTMSGLIDMQDNQITDVNYIDFNLINGVAAAEGRMVWNDDDGTMNIGLKGGNVNLQVGQEVVSRVKNDEGSTISNGDVVYVSGASGSNVQVKLPIASNSLTAPLTFAIATEDISNQGLGYVTITGKVRDVDTSGTPVSETWAAGNILWLSPTTAGKMTIVRPTAPDIAVVIGVVERAHATEGVIAVHPIVVQRVSFASDVIISSIADNDLLAWDSGTGTWANQTLVEAGLAVTSPITLTGSTIGWDSTLLDSFTWSDGAQASITQTFDISGTNPIITASNDLLGISGDFDIGGDLDVTGIAIIDTGLAVGTTLSSTQILNVIGAAGSAGNTGQLITQTCGAGGNNSGTGIKIGGTGGGNIQQSGDGGDGASSDNTSNGGTAGTFSYTGGVGGDSSGTGGANTGGDGGPFSLTGGSGGVAFGVGGGVNTGGDGGSLTLTGGNGGFAALGSSDVNGSGGDIILNGGALGVAGSGGIDGCVFLASLRGKVSVGSASTPTATLDVTGTFAVSGNTTLGGNLTVDGTIDCLEIFNSLGDLKIMPDVQGDVTFFQDTQVADASDGKAVVIHRKAAEGNSSLKLFVEDNLDPMIKFVGANKAVDVFLDDNAAVDLLTIEGKTAAVDTNVHIVAKDAENANLRLYSGTIFAEISMNSSDDLVITQENNIDQDIRTRFNDGGVVKEIFLDASLNIITHLDDTELNTGAGNITTTGDMFCTDLTSTGNSTLGDALTDVTTISGNLVLPKDSGYGIQVDVDAPTFGFRDLLGQVTQRNTGATKPTDAVFRDGIRGYRFAVGKEERFEYHIPHDYVLGTDIFIHLHWAHNSALVTGGNVVFEYEVSYAKGHNQAAYPASKFGTITGNASTIQYQHMLDEVQLSASTPSASQIDTDDLEPDGIIKLRCDVQSNNITSSGAVPDPFIDYVDIHYQSDNIGTKDKIPDFYV